MMKPGELHRHSNPRHRDAVHAGADRTQHPLRPDAGSRASRCWRQPWAEPPRPASIPKSPGKSARRSRGSNADSFSDRQQAAERLDELVGRPAAWGVPGRRIQPRAAGGRHVVRSACAARTAARRICRAGGPPLRAAKPAAADIGPLLDRLNSDRSRPARGRPAAVGSHACARASWSCRCWPRSKRRLADPGLSRQARRAMESVLDRAREAWVNADPAKVPLPAVSNEQMTRWLDELTAGEAEAAAGRVRRATAERELIDLLVRDDTRERLLGMLEQRIAAAADADAAARLREIADFARPAMAAEVWGHQKEDPETGQAADWQHRQHISVQHLIVGVPQLVEAAARPTHFDRIDDHTAHCVSGNSLTPGDYPVGVAIPNPNPAYEVMYYLVNLPTPRRRLAYDYHLKRDESERLADISQRTLDDFLAKRRPLDELHVMMLRQLDPRTVSRFVGPYFQSCAGRAVANRRRRRRPPGRADAARRDLCHAVHDRHARGRAGPGKARPLGPTGQAELRKQRQRRLGRRVGHRQQRSLARRRRVAGQADRRDRAVDRQHRSGARSGSQCRRPAAWSGTRPRPVRSIWSRPKR